MIQINSNISKRQRRFSFLKNQAVLLHSSFALISHKKTKISSNIVTPKWHASQFIPVMVVINSLRTLQHLAGIYRDANTNKNIKKLHRKSERKKEQKPLATTGNQHEHRELPGQLLMIKICMQAKFLEERQNKLKKGLEKHDWLMNDYNKWIMIMIIQIQNLRYNKWRQQWVISSRYRSFCI